MEIHKLPQFEIHEKEGVSNDFLQRNIYNFHDAVVNVGNLPYGRNSDRANYRLVLQEGKGTCATKHALLAKLAQEQGNFDIQLIIGMYRMTDQNTPGVGKVLAEHNLEYIPEAHCYLKVGNDRFDYTHREASNEPIQFVFEQVVVPEQIGQYKIDLHQKILAEWLIQERLEYRMTLEELWSIREQCIKALSD